MATTSLTQFTQGSRSITLLWIFNLLGLSLMLCSYNLNTQAADNNRVQKLWSPAERYKPVGFSRLLTCWFYCCCCCCSSGSSFCSSCCRSSCCRSSCSSCCQSQTDSKPTGHMMFCVCFLFRILHLKTSTERQKLDGKWVQLDHSCQNLNHLKWRIPGVSRCFDQRFDHLGVNLLLLHNSTPRATPHKIVIRPLLLTTKVG